MLSEGRFARRLQGVEEVPEPFRDVLRDCLRPGDEVRLLISNPAYESLGTRSPASLLALTDRRWLVFSDDEAGVVSVVACGFDDTLLVELTEILLFGRLKIDHAAGGASEACAIEFDTVDDQPYREAARLILQGIEGEPVAMALDGPAPSIEVWPPAFRNAVARFLPEGSRPLAAVHWPTVVGGLRRELAPAAVLLATDGELVIISEERAWTWEPGKAKYGHIATYFPLARLSGFGIRRHGPFSILDLEMHASHGGEALQFIFPEGQEQAVTEVLDRSLRRMRNTPPTSG